MPFAGAFSKGLPMVEQAVLYAFRRGFQQRASGGGISGALCLSRGSFSKGLPMMKQPVLYAFRQNVDSMSIRTHTSTTA